MDTPNISYAAQPLDSRYACSDSDAVIPHLVLKETRALFHAALVCF